MNTISKYRKILNSTHTCIKNFFVNIHLSISMEDNGKQYIKFKVAACLRILLKIKKDVHKQNKDSNIEDIRLVASLRKLEAESGLSYTIIQGVFSGTRELKFSSLISILENMNVPFSKFAELYDSVTEQQIINERNEIAANKRPKRQKQK